MNVPLCAGEGWDLAQALKSYAFFIGPSAAPPPLPVQQQRLVQQDQPWMNGRPTLHKSDAIDFGTGLEPGMHDRPPGPRLYPPMTLRIITVSICIMYCRQEAGAGYFPCYRQCQPGVQSTHRAGYRIPRELGPEQPAVFHRDSYLHIHTARPHHLPW
jgi:hypothetical protein